MSSSDAPIWDALAGRWGETKADAPPSNPSTRRIWYDGIPRFFEDAFPNARAFQFGSLPESRPKSPATKRSGGEDTPQHE